MPDFDHMNSDRPEDNDPLGGIDPMAWLESLAVRQGATEGFTTEHNVDVPEVDPNSVVIDEPGYTPSETIRSRHQPQPEQPAYEPPASAYESAPPPNEAYAPPTSSAEMGLPDGVDPLAWLEALAARQGATEGFTTEHNMEVPEIDPNSVVIDEPGYTPSEVIRSRHQPQPEPTPEPPSLPEEPVYQQEADYSQFQPPAAYEENALYGDTQPMSFESPSNDMGIPGGVDPLAWLEALAARQGATEGFTTEHSGIEVPEIDPNSVVIDEPGYTPSEVIRSRHQPQAAQPEPPSLPEEPTYEQPVSDESAYQQQQYDPSQYQQEYDYSQYQQQDDPSQYQQPAYDESTYQQQQYDPSQYQQEYDYSQDQQQYDPSQYQQPVYDESAYQEPQDEQPQQPTSEFAEFGIGADIDPLAWLEALAARQGATEGFTRDHNIEVPEIDPNSVVIDEPGYTPSETIRSRHQPPAAQPEPPPSLPEAPVFETPLEASDEIPDWLTEAEEAPSSDMSWLDTMAQDAGSDVTDFLGDMMGEETTMPDFFDEIGSFDLEPAPLSSTPAIEEAIPPTHEPDEVLASIDGLSDEQIAQMQIAGTLSPVQELAWLQRQAMQLAAARDVGEGEDYLDDAELELAAEASDLPPWLQNATIVDKEAESDVTLAFIDEIIPPPTPEEVPDWLAGDTSAVQLPEIDLGDFVNEIQAQSPVEPAGDFLGIDQYDPSGDEWAEALDEEHDILASGKLDEHTEWIESVFQSVEVESSLDTEMESAELVPEMTFEAPAETSEEVPDWLSTLADEPSTSDADQLDDLPDWLKPMAQGVGDEDEYDIARWLIDTQSVAKPGETGILQPLPEPVVEIALPAAENERLAQARAGSLPSWAVAPALPPTRPVASTAPPQPLPVKPPVQAVTPPEPPRQRVAVTQQPIPPAHPPAFVPELAEFAAYRAALENNPNDHTARLNLARALNQTGDVNASLNQYQTLVENLGETENVKSDLVVIAAQHPVARRILGDVYMREGYLQEALDAYRGALNNL